MKPLNFKSIPIKKSLVALFLILGCSAISGCDEKGEPATEDEYNEYTHTQEDGYDPYLVRDSLEVNRSTRKVSPRTTGLQD